MTQKAALATQAPAGTMSDESQDIDDFIYLMSHDVRASVRALLELPQWIVEDLEEAGIEVKGSVAQSIDLMNRHTARLDRMLMDLLAYSRVGRLQDVVRVDIAAALDDVLAELHLPESMEMYTEIGCNNVMMGEQDGMLLLSALIGNAVKHHHATIGKITLRTQLEGQMIRISVIDDGPGIPERFHAKVLGAMTTLRPRDEVEGTGMGLANVRKIAIHYGGYMSLHGVEGPASGLRVDVVIPHGCETLPLSA